MIRKLTLIAAALCLTMILSAQSITGKWKTIDENTGKEQSIVEIYSKNGKIFGKVVYISDPKYQNPNLTCVRCKDYRKGQKVIGMDIITNMVYDTKEKKYTGKVLDPESGKEYNGKIWLDLETGKLRLRGYLGPFYRTQTWIAAE